MANMDLACVESICSRCGGTVLDLGIEMSDKYLSSRKNGYMVLVHQ